METSRLINVHGAKSKYYRNRKNSSHSNGEPFTTRSIEFRTVNA